MRNFLKVIILKIEKEIKRMINFLLELGIDEKEIKNMMEQITDFVDYEDHEKKQKKK